MHPALWLLLGLRLRGWLRRIGRAARTVKGAILYLLGLLAIALWLLPVLFLTEPAQPEALERLRLYGPAALLFSCVLTVLFSSGEQGVTFSPAEVDFLFPGPFTRRELLQYKLAVTVGTALLAASFLTMALRQHAALAVAAYVGLVLAIVFLQFFAMALALAASTAGARAYTWRRLAVLVFLGLLAAGSLLYVGGDLFLLSRGDLMTRIAASPTWRLALAPLRWFVEAFTAERLWPDLAWWAALGLTVDAALAGIILALDAQYLEAAAVASERLYARIQQMRSGGTTMATLPLAGRRRIALPMPPRWSGIGPLVWRQLLAVPRSRGPYVLLFLMALIALPPLFAETADPGDSHHFLRPIVAILAVPLLMTPLLPYDFRGDIDRMETLKSLPIASWAVAVGQTLAPVVVTTVLQWLALAVVWALVPGPALAFVGGAALAVPYNAILFSIENLLYLLFPTRLTPAAPGDFQNIGRQMLLFIARMAGLGAALAAAALAGLVGYFLGGRSWAGALAAAWLVLALCALALVPLMALAFQRFDVARDTPP